jgi:type I restriction enzyme S subunit
MGRFSFPLPPLSDQKRIAALLGALDEKIDSNRRLARLLEETAATLFRARFVDFVGIEEFEDSELGLIPRDWCARPVGDVVTIVGGSTPSTKNPAFWGGNHCWITPKDLSGAASPIVLDTARHVTDEGVRQISSRLLPTRTVLLSSRAPVGYTAVSFVPIAVNQGFIAIPPTDSIPSEFVYFWLRERMDEIKAHAGGTTFAEISKRAFRPLPMIVPPNAALDMFRAVAEPVFDKMAGLEAERRTLTQIRDAVLPKLVSGEIRLPDSPDVAEAIEPMVA